MNGLPVMDLAGRMTRLRDALDDLDALLAAVKPHCNVIEGVGR